MFAFMSALSAKHDEQCEICCEALGDETNRVSCSRGHTFCISCFRSYAKETILGMNKMVLSCMAQNCREKYSEEVAKRLLDGKLFKKLRENGSRCTCNCNCSWKRKASQLTKADQERLEREERLTNDALRRCPECKKPIVKEDGCNHVICPSCETHMCYQCGVRLAEWDYQHACYGNNARIRRRLDADPPPDLQGRLGVARNSTEGLNWVTRVTHHVDAGRRIRPEPPLSLITSAMRPINWLEPTAVEKRLQEAVQLTTGKLYRL